MLQRSAEDLGITLGRRLVEKHPVAHSAEEGRVGHVLHLEIGRDDQHQQERYMEHLACSQRQVIVLVLERDDPAVEQVARSDALAAEVVDHEGSAVCLHLERGLVETLGGAVAQVARFERHLAADDNQRPPDPHPPPVDPPAQLGIELDRAMALGVEDTNELPFDFDAVRNPEFAFTRLVEEPCHGCLAVAGRAKDEETTARGGGQPAQCQVFGFEDQTLEASGDALRRELGKPLCLPDEHCRISLE